MATMAQIRVPRTKMISSAARMLFLRPNWIGVKAALKIRLRMNGRMMINGICLVAAL